MRRCENDTICCVGIVQVRSVYALYYMGCDIHNIPYKGDRMIESIYLRQTKSRIRTIRDQKDTCIPQTGTLGKKRSGQRISIRIAASSRRTPMRATWSLYKLLCFTDSKVRCSRVCLLQNENRTIKRLRSEANKNSNRMRSIGKQPLSIWAMYSLMWEVIHSAVNSCDTHTQV